MIVSATKAIPDERLLLLAEQFRTQMEQAFADNPAMLKKFKAVQDPNATPYALMFHQARKDSVIAASIDVDLALKAGLKDEFRGILEKALSAVAGNEELRQALVREEPIFAKLYE